MTNLDLLHSRIELLEAAVASLLQMNNILIEGKGASIERKSMQSLAEFKNGAEILWERWGATS